MYGYINIVKIEMLIYELLRPWIDSYQFNEKGCIKYFFTLLVEKAKLIDTHYSLYMDKQHAEIV